MPSFVFKQARLPLAVAAALVSAHAFAADQVEMKEIRVSATARQHTRNYTVPASSAATGLAQHRLVLGVAVFGAVRGRGE